MTDRTPSIDRFNAKVDKSESCWLWSAFKGKDGYGQFWSGEYIGGDSSRGPVMVLAHRWSYEHHIGPIPEGLYVLHKCDVPSCVNPDHLFVGTQADNVRDCAAKGRRNQTRVFPKRYCTIEGCDEKYNAKGLCHYHYHKAYKAAKKAAAE